MDANALRILIPDDRPDSPDSLLLGRLGNDAPVAPDGQDCLAL